MKKNIGRKSKSNKGITLIVLVITIIVLLILAGVTLSSVFSQDGIFSRAEQAKGKYGQAKARETLELAFSNLQVEKYEARLTVTALDARITEEIGRMSGEEIGEDKSEVIVDGYRFTIDRTVPKVLEELGPADGVIISAVVIPNEDWINPKATVKGIIKTYSGGTITSSTAEVTRGNANMTKFPTTGGNFTIVDIAEDTDITITATDSNNKTNTKTINVVLAKDITPPTITKLNVTTEGMIIMINAEGNDKNLDGKEESGIKQFNYEIISEQDTTLTGIPDEQRTGIFKKGQTVEITATKEAKYTIKITATDNCNNTTTSPTTTDIEVGQPRIELNKEVVYLGLGIKDKVTANVRYSENKNVKWISSDPTIAEVTQDGTITAKKQGKTTIIVQGNELQNLENSVTVYVSNKIDFNDYPLHILTGDVNSRNPLSLVSSSSWALMDCYIPLGGAVRSVTLTGTYSGGGNNFVSASFIDAKGTIMDTTTYFGGKFNVGTRTGTTIVFPDADNKVIYLRCESQNQYGATLSLSNVILNY